MQRADYDFVMKLGTVVWDIFPNPKKKTGLVTQPVTLLFRVQLDKKPHDEMGGHLGLVMTCLAKESENIV